MSETGHAINIANFEMLISCCESWGSKYRPSNPALFISAMKTLLLQAQEMQKNFDKLEAEAKNDINSRQKLFADLDSHVICTINSYEQTEATPHNIKTARHYVNLITGNNVRIPKLPDGKPKPGHISNSHQSFEMRMDNFDKLIQFYVGDPLYNPNETQLSVLELKALYEQLQSANSKAIYAKALAAQTMIDRDALLYDVPVGLVDTALRCKKYIRSAFGSRSDEAKMISKCKFRRKVNQKKRKKSSKSAKRNGGNK